jgi:hypothetical protein
LQSGDGPREKQRRESASDQNLRAHVSRSPFS